MIFDENFHNSLAIIIKIKLIIIVQLTSLLVAEYATPIVGFLGVCGSCTYIWYKVYTEIKNNKKTNKND